MYVGRYNKQGALYIIHRLQTLVSGFFFINSSLQVICPNLVIHVYSSTTVNCLPLRRHENVDTVCHTNAVFLLISKKFTNGNP